MNKKVEYSLMTLQHFLMLAPGEKISTKEVCETTGSPFDATARVMQQMTQAGLLKSEQGVKGGYYLSSDLKEISYLQLIEWILGPVEVTKCINNLSACENVSKCNIQNPVQKLNSKLRDFYSKLSVFELLVGETVSIGKAVNIDGTVNTVKSIPREFNQNVQL
jgi:Rrf2 family protein